MDARALKTEESFYTSQGDEIDLSEAATETSCRYCSRARPASAKRASWSTWC